MYQEAGYGANWQPEANQARRTDPYIRTYIAFGTLFGIGFLLVTIIVLSLIPLYMSHDSSIKTPNNNNNKTQVSKISINSYSLEIRSPFNDFNSQTVISETNNRQALQAALTAMIQEDVLANGSVVDINDTITNSYRLARQTSDLLTITFDFNTFSNRPCSLASCLDEFRSRLLNLLSNSNKTTSRVFYERTNTTEVYWLYFQLPQAMQWNASLVYVDLNQISSLLDKLLLIDKTKNQQYIESTTSNLID